MMVIFKVTGLSLALEALAGVCDYSSTINDIRRACSGGIKRMLQENCACFNIDPGKEQ